MGRPRRCRMGHLLRRGGDHPNGRHRAVGLPPHGVRRRLRLLSRERRGARELAPRDIGIRHRISHRALRTGIAASAGRANRRREDVEGDIRLPEPVPVLLVDSVLHIPRARRRAILRHIANRMGPRYGVDDQLRIVPLPVPLGVQPEGGRGGGEAENSPVGDGHRSDHAPSPVRRTGHVERGAPRDGRYELHGADDGAARGASRLRVLERGSEVGGRARGELFEDQGTDVGIAVPGRLGGEAATP
mmetsp:Transcript_34802/g.84101  ORF Transcript_34802/g.84101 Transcript_34802/m.84101 type:complete len:245 (+) Transcript_34802:454-1188(+)